MAKLKTHFQCNKCGYQTFSWQGRCPECGQWNSIQELKIELNTVNPEYEVYKLSDIKYLESIKVKTGLDQVDITLDGGLTRGSLILLSGEPGVGKSTLLLKLMSSLSTVTNQNTLYITGEESCEQLGARAKRLRLSNEKVYLMNESKLSNIIYAIDSIKPEFIVIDSIQTISSQEISAASGTASQIREITSELMSYIKSKKVTCILVGHITKDGSIAGPKLLEHMVDVVVNLEKNMDDKLRILRTQKNRFGRVHEIGIFEMSETGLIEIQDRFIDRVFSVDSGEVIGRSYCCINDGGRNVLIEVEALVVKNNLGNSKRVARGIDTSKFAILLAVIEKYLKVQLRDYDIYLEVKGLTGKYDEEIDLATIAAILSSLNNRKNENLSLYQGQVSLNGEVKSRGTIENYSRFTKIFTSVKNASAYGNYATVGLFNIKDLKNYFPNRPERLSPIESSSKVKSF